MANGRIKIQETLEKLRHVKGSSMIVKQVSKSLEKLWEHKNAKKNLPDRTLKNLGEIQRSLENIIEVHRS